MTPERLPTASPAEGRIASFAFFVTLAVGALSAFVLVVATEPASRLTLSSLGKTFLVAGLYSAFFTVPGGILAAVIAKKVTRARRGRHRLSEWLIAGASWGGLAGAACFLFPLLVLAPSAPSVAFAMTAAVVTLAGAVPGATTGAIVAWYCRSLQRRR